VKKKRTEKERKRNEPETGTEDLGILLYRQQKTSDGRERRNELKKNERATHPRETHQKQCTRKQKP